MVALVLFSFGVQPPPVQASQLTTDDLKVLAVSIATADHLQVNRFVTVIECESQFNPATVGDYGTSFGIAQFHNLKEWGMTRADAEDPYVALPRMAVAWEHHQEFRWSCYRKLYGADTS